MASVKLYSNRSGIGPGLYVFEQLASNGRVVESKFAETFEVRMLSRFDVLAANKDRCKTRGRRVYGNLS
jgi:hypothetical protein